MDMLGPGVLPFIERLSSPEGISIIERWTLKCVLYREVFFPIVSFIWSVLYQRFHCVAKG